MTTSGSRRQAFGSGIAGLECRRGQAAHALSRLPWLGGTWPTGRSTGTARWWSSPTTTAFCGTGTWSCVCPTRLVGGISAWSTRTDPRTAMLVDARWHRTRWTCWEVLRRPGGVTCPDNRPVRCRSPAVSRPWQAGRKAWRRTASSR